MNKIQIKNAHKIIKQILQDYVDKSNKVWEELGMQDEISDDWERHGIYACFREDDPKVSFDGELCGALMGMAEFSMYDELVEEMYNKLNEDGFCCAYDGMGDIVLGEI